MSHTRIVETVTATSMAELLQRRRAAAEAAPDERADLVELRLDGVLDLDVAGAVVGCPLPVVATCRPTWEGGAFDGSEDERRRIMADAAAAGADYVDVEWRAVWRPDLSGGATQLVLSEHDFNGIPADLHERLAAMRAERPALVKLAVMPSTAADCVRLRHLTRGDEATVVIAMGAFGLVTRLLPAHFGSVWTYCGQAAPGQIGVREIVQQFRLRERTRQTAVYGVIGRPLRHSASPAMHNAALKALGLDAVYVPLEAVSGADALTLADDLGVQGLSVTAPFKQAWVFSGQNAGTAGDAGAVTCDDAASATLQTINTLKRGTNGWVGRNVDGDGFLDPLDARQCDVAGVRVVIAGAGGAARSVARALIDRGARVAISARRPEAARALADSLGVEVETWPLSTAADILVNATNVGTWPDVDASPIPASAIRASGASMVYDLVYNPEDTALVRAARQVGAQTIGGLEMLVGQALRQMAWWTGQRPSAEVMTHAARKWIAAAEGSAERAREEGMSGRWE